METNSPIFLEDFIEEIVENEERYGRFNVYFKRWINAFHTLNQLTEKVPVCGNYEILIKNKYKFLDELYRLSKMKLIKSSIFEKF